MKNRSLGPQNALAGAVASLDAGADVLDSITADVADAAETRKYLD